jgi:glycosyltransferase involved in cell wall biosynthesis
MPGFSPPNPSCAVFLPIRSFGGHEKMLMEWLGRARAQHGLAVRIHCAPNEPLAQACEAAGLGRPIVSYPARANGLRDLFVTWRLLGQIPRELPVLFAPGVLQILPGQWLAAFLRRRQAVCYVPMAYSCRHMGLRGGALRDWLVGRAIRHVDLWITITEQQRMLLTETWRFKAPVLVVPNRLALLEHEFPDARPVGRPLRVLFAGRFDANQKGLQWLCDRLRARRDQWRGRFRFTFKGEGDFELALRRLSEELGREHVEVAPWGDIGEAARKADVLLLASRCEGLPLAALEAIHHGLPVVATRHAGLADFLLRPYLFDYGDDDGMWAALKALQDPARHAAALAYSRSRIDAVLSPAAYRDGIARIAGVLARMSRSAVSGHRLDHARRTV